MPDVKSFFELTLREVEQRSPAELAEIQRSDFHVQPLSFYKYISGQSSLGLGSGNQNRLDVLTKGFRARRQGDEVIVTDECPGECPAVSWYFRTGKKLPTDLDERLVGAFGKELKESL
jgi:hypothetical protein